MFLFLIFFSVYRYVVAKQYCNLSPHKDADVCIALSFFRNESSGANDLNIHFSAQFKDNGGWAALGTGTTMHDSLMFVMYPTEDKHGAYFCENTPYRATN